MEFYDNVGLLVLGSRLKRTGERFLKEVASVYKKKEIVFETAWFPIFYLLDKNPSISLKEIALKLNMTHSACSQMVLQLQKKGLLETKQSEADARKRVILFTAKGSQLMEEVRPIWTALERTLNAHLLNEELRETFMQGLTLLEEQLVSTKFSEATLQFLNKGQSTIVYSLVDSEEMISKVREFCKQENIETPDFTKSIFISSIEGQIVAAVNYEQKEDTFTILDLYVRKENRGSGVAYELLQALIKQQGTDKIELASRNPHLVSLLLKVGCEFTVLK